ncbi:MAG: hypothetical protein Q8M15_00265 [Bacteroidota bacterium]|nr:hypothetical protein [Bacteroidota bacterium]
MNEPQKSNKNTLSLVLLLLIASLGANFYQWRNHTSTVTEYTNQVDSMNTAGIDIQRELESINMELEKYRGIAGNLDTLLNDANAKIAKQEQKIKKIMAEEKDKTQLNKKLKAELEELKKLREEYLDQIDNLMAENKALKTENSDLTTKVENLNEQKNMLESKVTTASQLKVEYLKLNSYKKRNSGKYVESVLAKRTNKIDVCFTVMDNKITPPGDKMVYLVITEPTGKTLMGYTKAQFTTVDNVAVDATASQKINYTGEKQDLCLAFENEERILESGTYTINVYMENVLVHQSTYVLK